MTTNSPQVLNIYSDINGKKIKTYMGNQKLKAANVRIGWTKEMIEEYSKCQDDIIYYANNYFYHVDPNEGRKVIKLWDWQEEILRDFQKNRFNIVLQSRQSGKCVDYNTHITIRNVYDFEEQHIKIGKFFDKIYKHKNTKHLPISNNEEKFVNLIENHDFEVYTNNGWQKFDGVGKTVPYFKYEIQTKNHKLICADDHLLVSGTTKKLVMAKNLKVGDFLRTKKGLDEIVSITVQNCKKNMYDLLNVANGKTYYTNGLLSHNTTIASIFCTWYALFNKDKTIVIISKDRDAAKDVLARVKLGLENLPFGIQQGVVEWNKTSVVFDNGSKIIVKSSARGTTGQVLFLDEVAYIKGWSEFSMDSLPIISASRDSKIVMVSTPNGRNHFCEYWTRANKPQDNPMWNKYIPHFVEWNKIPGRDEKWKADEIAKYGRDGEAYFAREYECKFDSKGGSLLLAETLSYLYSLCIDPINIDDLYIDRFKRLRDYKKYIKMFHKVQEGHIYTIGLDGATNTKKGDGDEYSGMILDVTSFPIKQVCSISVSKGLDYREVPYIVKELAEYYNNAWIFTENNEGSGRETNRTLEDLGYDNLYWENSTLAGFRTTTKSKKLGCKNLQTVADNGNLLIYDVDTIGQLNNFVKTKTSYAGDGDEPDDKCMSLIAALHYLMIDDDLMLQNIFGDKGEFASHHKLFQKIINKPHIIEQEDLKSILKDADVKNIMFKDENEEILNRIVNNLNLIDEKKQKEIDAKKKKYADVLDYSFEEVFEKDKDIDIFIPF